MHQPRARCPEQVARTLQRGGVADPMPDHHAVYSAIVAGDPDAARAAMEALIDKALHDADMARTDA